MAAVTQNVRACVCVCVSVLQIERIGGGGMEKMEERRCGKITGVEYYYVCRGTQSAYTHSAM